MKRTVLFLCIFAIFIICIVLIAFSACEKKEQPNEQTTTSIDTDSTTTIPTTTPMTTTVEQDGLSAVFFPVGKGDCIIIQCDGETLLIDSGYAQNAPDILNYLKKQNITRLSAVIATHPDKDHIGGFPEIIESGIDIDVLYKTDAKKIDNNAYDSFIFTLNNYNINIVNPELGSSFELGSAYVTFISPNPTSVGTYKNINDTSIVVKIQYAEQSMLFTGDMLKTAEKDLLEYVAETGFDLSSAILKVGHHGSAKASTKKFLQAVKPLYAVITCGVDEDGKHTLSDKIVDRLETMGTSILRTDTDGMIRIIITPDGEIVIG